VDYAISADGGQIAEWTTGWSAVKSALFDWLANNAWSLRIYHARRKRALEKKLKDEEGSRKGEVRNSVRSKAAS
jgi:hypothetical protein